MHSLSRSTDDAADQAGHGESHEQNGEEGGGQDKEEVVDLTTCYEYDTFFSLPYLSLSLFFSLLPGHPTERGFILFNLGFLRLSVVLSNFRSFLVFSFNLACFCGVIRIRYADGSFIFFPNIFALYLFFFFSLKPAYEVE